MSDTLLAPWWESKAFRRLELLVGVLAMIVVCRVAFDESLAWLAWAFGGAVAILLCVTRWPYGALLFLIGASAMPRAAVELFGWNARPEHFAASIVALCIGIWLISGGHHLWRSTTLALLLDPPNLLQRSVGHCRITWQFSRTF
jgi:hypothetical protein